MYQHVKEFQKFLQENNAKAAFLRLPENLVLFTQYWPRYGFSFIFIPAFGEPTVICPENEEIDTKDVGLDRVIPVGDVRLSDGDPNETVISILQRLAKEHDIKADSTIAIEMGEDMIAPSYVANKVIIPGDKTREIITRGFNTNKFIPVKNAIREIRSIKNENDIAKLDAVNGILLKALDYFEMLIEQPGIREIDVLAETECYFLKLACGTNNCKTPRIFSQLSTGLNTTEAFADGILSHDRVLKRGDLAMYEVGACIDGYWADLTRTGCVGGFQGQKKEIYDIVKGSFNAGVKACKDGVLAEDVDAACRDYINKTPYGQYFVHATGHGTGFNHSEKYPVLEPGVKDVMRNNMTVCVEPGIYIPEIGGIRHEETVLVGTNGGRILGR